MAAIRKRGSRYHVQIRKAGQLPLTQSFHKLTNARAWAKKVESEIERGVYIDDLAARSTTLSDVFDRYEREILPTKGSIATVKSQLKILRRLIGEVSLRDVTTHLLAEHVIAKRSVDGQTLRKDLSLIQRILNTAVKDWGIHLPYGNPVSQIRLPKAPPGRERRLEPGEEIILGLGDHGKLRALGTELPSSTQLVILRCYAQSISR